MVDVTQDRLGKHGDDFYEALMAVHAGLSEHESAGLNARLVLIMANQIADINLLKEILIKAAASNPIP